MRTTSGRLKICLGLLCASALLLLGQARADPLHLQIDAQKSRISAAVATPLERLRNLPASAGTFHIVSGEIDGDPAHPQQSGHVALTIDATSYDSGNRHRDNAVLSSALDTADYQTISFESTRLEQVQIDVAGKMGHAVVVGELTLHGTTREIRVPVNVSLGNDGTLFADGEVTFPYTDFGVRVPRLLFALPAGKDVTVSFHIVGEPVTPQAMK